MPRPTMLILALLAVTSPVLAGRGRVPSVNRAHGF
jgi:hypothetical protein